MMNVGRATSGHGVTCVSRPFDNRGSTSSLQVGNFLSGTDGKPEIITKIDGSLNHDVVCPSCRA